MFLLPCFYSHPTSPCEIVSFDQLSLKSIFAFHEILQEHPFRVFLLSSCYVSSHIARLCYSCSVLHSNVSLFSPCYSYVSPSSIHLCIPIFALHLSPHNIPSAACLIFPYSTSSSPNIIVTFDNNYIILSAFHSLCTHNLTLLCSLILYLSTSPTSVFIL
ncbi:uncharacterized protein SPAPADRAFT_144684 [Spathaspora passalidarum NRRL Y-27907]|uniref:Uncharacterized protein n=1 Tax=Spathaspora passalidarum (strain NRRL Y-27907 / 11-Y1) TaxID=619300 RepID=G3ALS6_SPAPN|nr:uncharacterized protein SPAPADRAFT_135828 [Spathaspora passalidarum NRRL Y-27907]XP_007378010.1 uncharacterized protein SPAPADRAFT_144684 [Spathaspora passalidarum NRRL Y-27907]EGW30244.1 hypothetical protein SPAPADRAFT_144684 [Spathaspora passalidarum NRRL Y-27907]EGW32685.1 hypothetical protein SPAPADRAFT_135828 [Spathaspora passalidarum NRRL Y-27907]